MEIMEKCQNNCCNPPALIPNIENPNLPNNNCSPMWSVNLNYITQEDLFNFYGFIPDSDMIQNPSKTNFVTMAIAYSSERINSLSGNKIEGISFNNLNLTQKNLVQRATSKLTIYYLRDGMEFIRASVSYSGNGISVSSSPPNEPDYVLQDVYNLLQQANLYKIRQGYSINYCNNCKLNCNNTCNFNNTNILNSCDSGEQFVRWQNAIMRFLSTKGIISSDKSVNIKDITDTEAKIDLSVKSGSSITVDTNSFELVPPDNKLTLLDNKVSTRFNEVITYPNLTTPSKTIIGGINDNKSVINTAQGRIDDLALTKQNINDDTLTTINKTIPGAINEINNFNNDIVTHVTNNTTDINKLMIQNFDIQFLTINITSTSNDMVLYGKITINNNDIDKDVWSFTSNLMSIANPNFSDFGTNFKCYPINGTPNSVAKNITGTWTNGGLSVKFFSGYQIEVVDKNTYNIIFYGNGVAFTTLSLDISSLNLPSPPPPPTPLVNYKNLLNNDNTLKIKDNTLVNKPLTSDDSLVIVENDNDVDIRVNSGNLANKINQINNYPKLLTDNKKIVSAINELYNDVNLLKFQNFDISFQTIIISKEEVSIKLIGKITIEKDVSKKVWSISSNAVSKLNPMLYDFSRFVLLPIDGTIRNNRINIKGVWSGNNFPIRSYNGIEIDDSIKNMYKIAFYDDISTNQAILTLDTTLL